MKIHQIQAKSPEELQHTSLRIRRTFEEYKERQEQRISKQEILLSTQLNPRNMFREAFKLKSVLKRRIKGTMRL